MSLNINSTLKRKKNILDNSGSTIIMVLMISSVLSILISFLADRLITMKKVSADLTTNITYTIAIQSVTDYAKSALQQRWCFQDDGEKGLLNKYYESNLLPALPSECISNYTHLLSTNRLLLPEIYALGIAEKKLNPDFSNLVKGTFPGITNNGNVETIDINGADKAEKSKNLAKSMLLKNFTVRGDISLFSDIHPLKAIVKNVKGKQPLKYVQITYEVIDQISLPHNGDQVYIKITTSLLDDGEKVLINGAQLASETSLIFSTPRELNIYSLILRGSLILNSAPPSTTDNEKGNGYIPPIAESKAAAGVEFYSPVFINKDLILPDPTNKNAPKSPVSFYETVTLGRGFIASGSGEGFISEKALGEFQTWDDTKLFRGLGKGFETDSAEDLGLNAIAGEKNTITNNSQLVEHCINRIRQENMPSLDFTSQLYGDIDKSVGPTYGLAGPVKRKYIFSFLKNNVTNLQKRFSKQSIDSLTNFLPGNNSVGENVYGSPNEATQVIKAIPDENYLNNVPATKTARKFSMFLDILYRNTTRINIPLPDEYNNTPGQINIFLKPANGPPVKLNVTIKNILINNVFQPQFRSIELSIDKIEDLKSEPITYIRITGADNTCREGKCLPSPAGSGMLKSVYLRKFTDFADDNKTVCSPNKLYTQSSYTSQTLAGHCSPESEIKLTDFGQFSFPKLTDDIGTMDSECDNKGATNFNFSTDEIEKYYSDNSADGWAFSHSKNKDDGSYPERKFTNFNSNNATSAAIHSLCEVPSTVDRIVGNFMCKSLIIKARTTPLAMIGTFIVIDRLQIHSSAVEKGVKFYSIHHPEAVDILKDNAVLKTGTNQSCNSLPLPNWHPDPGLATLSNRIKCSPISTFKDGSPTRFPFRWTSVTADCVRFAYKKCNQDLSKCAELSETEPEPLCIKKIRNYYLKSIERRYVLPK